MASVKNRPALSLGAKGRGAQGESQDAFMAQARVLELLWPFFLLSSQNFLAKSVYSPQVWELGVIRQVRPQGWSPEASLA